MTIHRRVNSRDAGPPREGYEMDQTLHLRGANFKVRWTLTEADRPDRATWEGRGPAHSYARTAYALHDLNGGGTRFEYENEFKAPGGFLGAAASRMLIGGVPEREARALAREPQEPAREPLVRTRNAARAAPPRTPPAVGTAVRR